MGKARVWGKQGFGKSTDLWKARKEGHKGTEKAEGQRKPGIKKRDGESRGTGKRGNRESKETEKAKRKRKIKQGDGESKKRSGEWSEKERGRGRKYTVVDGESKPVVVWSSIYRFILFFYLLYLLILYRIC